jgi:hypothetical protein
MCLFYPRKCLVYSTVSRLAQPKRNRSGYRGASSFKNYLRLLGKVKEIRIVQPPPWCGQKQRVTLKGDAAKPQDAKVGAATAKIIVHVPLLFLRCLLFLIIIQGWGDQRRIATLKEVVKKWLNVLAIVASARIIVRAR